MIIDILCINLQIIDNIKNIQIRKEGLDRSYIKLFFKKIPDFEETRPIKNFIIKSIILGLDKEEIITRIIERFSKTRDEAQKDYIKNSSEITLEKLTSINTPLITTDYLNRANTISGNYKANILIENVASLETANKIMKFIYLSFDLYNLTNPDGYNNPQIEIMREFKLLQNKKAI